MKRVVAAVAAVLLLAGCGGSAGASKLDPAAWEAKSQEAGVVILDVRTPGEFAEGHIQGAVNVDFESGTFETDISALDKATTYAIYCRSGNRSGQASGIMTKAGFTSIFDLKGGIIAWGDAGKQLVIE